MVGQSKLLDIINNYTVDTLPKSLMLVGEKGCGKHTVAQLISNKIGIPLHDISDDLTLDTIEKIYSGTTLSMFLIDMTELRVRDQNTILKFLEEPPVFAHIIVLNESLFGTLETINNRCSILKFDKYSDEELSELIPDNNPDKARILQFTTTPGQIFTILNAGNINDMFNYASVAIENFDTANASQILSIGNHIAYKDEKGKYDLRVFILILESIIRQKYIEASDKKYQILYSNMCELKRTISVSGCDTKNAFEHFLTKSRLQMGGI